MHGVTSLLNTNYVATVWQQFWVDWFLSWLIDLDVPYIGLHVYYVDNSHCDVHELGVTRISLAIAIFQRKFSSRRNNDHAPRRELVCWIMAPGIHE